MEECSFEAAAFEQDELTNFRAIGITCIDSVIYSFIALPPSETIINLKSVNIFMRYHTFCSSNVQVIILTGFNARSFLYFYVLPILSELKYQWKTSRRDNSVDFFKTTEPDGVYLFLMSNCVISISIFPVSP